MLSKFNATKYALRNCLIYPSQVKLPPTISPEHTACQCRRCDIPTRQRQLIAIPPGLREQSGGFQACVSCRGRVKEIRGIHSPLPSRSFENNQKYLKASNPGIAKENMAGTEANRTEISIKNMQHSLSIKNMQHSVRNNYWLCASSKS